MENSSDDEEMTDVICPHCGGEIQVKSKYLNCRIFRHGCRKDNRKQLPPHASQQESEELMDPIYGCGKPFQIIEDKKQFSAIKTSYAS